MRKAGWLVLLLLQACVDDGRGHIRPLRPLELATSPYDGVNSAALVGSLMYEHGCLLFRDEATRALLLPVWPTGSIFNGTSVIFHEPAKSDQPILVAQQFMITGRRLPWSALASDIYGPFQQQCGATPFLVSKVRPAN